MTVTSSPSTVGRRRHGVEQLARDQRGVLGLGQVLDQDRELVAAQARDGVGLAQALAQALAHEREQAVAGDVAEAVVDRLEAVEVEDHHRDQALVAPRPGERALEPVLEQRAVGEPGQLVVLRQAAELLGAGAAGPGRSGWCARDGSHRAAVLSRKSATPSAIACRSSSSVPARASMTIGARQPRSLRGAHQLEAVAVGQRRVDQADVEPARAQPGERRSRGRAPARP